MAEYKQRRWEDLDLGSIAIDVSYGLMLLRYKGAEEKYLQQVRGGIELLEFLKTAEKTIEKKEAKTSEDTGAYLAVQKLLSSEESYGRPQLSREELKDSVKRGEVVKNRLSVLLQDPAEFPKEEMEEYQSFFAKLGSKL